jgi:hypothetical protein
MQPAAEVAKVPEGPAKVADAPAKSVTPKVTKTITCVKGKMVKKVTSLTPTCPSGYKKK